MQVFEDDKLAWYHDQPIVDTETYWAEVQKPSAWTASGTKTGFLPIPFFEKIFLKHLPRTGKIIEAGCGYGNYLVALRQRGYDIEGIDSSGVIIKAVKSHYPDCPAQISDVRTVPRPDDYYAAYISLGVLEHFQEGPAVALREARRLVRNNGKLFISVPCLNLVRKLKARLGRYSKTGTGKFYQYAFEVNEFSAILKNEGFSVIDHYPYDAVTGLRRESVLMRNIFKRLPAKILSGINRLRFFNIVAGHMVLFIAVNNKPFSSVTEPPNESFPQAINAAAKRSDNDFFTWFAHDRNTDAAFTHGVADFSLNIAEPLEKYWGELGEKTALEIGHGGGRILAAATTRFHHVYGVDIHECNGLVTQELHRRGHQNFTLLRGDGSSLPLKNQSVDCVYSFIVLQHVEHIGIFLRYLQEVRRVLKPSGIAILYFGRYSRWSFNRTARWRYLADRIIENIALPRGYREEKAPVNEINLRLTLPYAKRQVQKVGLEPVSVLVSWRSGKGTDSQRKYGGQHGLIIRN